MTSPACVRLANDRNFRRADGTGAERVDQQTRLERDESPP
jgi:hypothetical protein